MAAAENDFGDRHKAVEHHLAGDWVLVENRVFEFRLRFEADSAPLQKTRPRPVYVAALPRFLTLSNQPIMLSHHAVRTRSHLCQDWIDFRVPYPDHVR